MKRTVEVILLVLFLALVAACSSKEKGGANATPSAAGGTPVTTPSGTQQVPGDPAEGFRKVQEAIGKTSSYTITAAQTNLVLPQWGGADGGTVKVAERGNVATAVLGRTGEQNATYAITRTNGQTYFKRSTCDETFRVPGGGGDVLMPFLFHLSGAIGKASNPRWVMVSQSGDNSIRLAGNVQGIGEVTIEVDPATFLPRRIVAPTGGKTLSWELSAWDATTVSAAVPGNVRDRGPGGIPC